MWKPDVSRAHILKVLSALKYPAVGACLWLLFSYFEQYWGQTTFPW